MNLKHFSQKLRRIADAIDDLLGTDTPATSRETAQTATKIKRSMAKIRTVAKKRKAYSYKGKHWTQKPENKAKLRRMLKAAAHARQQQPHAIM